MAKRLTSPCWCDSSPTRDPSGDEDFADGTGFVCVVCSANVTYTRSTKNKER